MARKPASASSAKKSAAPAPVSGDAALLPGMPTVGDPAPDFRRNDQSGKAIALKDLRGQWVVLYFYPKDDTPGCTVEACGFRDGWGDFKKVGAVVLGVSPDDEKSHARFAGKFDLPFSLLADTDQSLCRAYGVWVEKSMYGRKYMGVNRATFLIDPQGVVAAVWPKVKPEGHNAQVLTRIAAAGKA